MILTAHDRKFLNAMHVAVELDEPFPNLQDALAKAHQRAADWERRYERVRRAWRGRCGSWCYWNAGL